MKFFARCFAIVAASLAASAASAANATKPNIVLIYADDLGYGDVSCYGATSVETPNIDRLAAEGMRFTDGHSPSATCTPSRYAMLTGEYAWRRKGTGIAKGDAALIIEPGRPTLPSLLKSAGYATGVVGKWHLGLGNGDLDWNGKIAPGPLEIGFDECFLVPATGDRVPCVYVENHRVANLDPADPIRISYEGPVDDGPTGKENPELLTMHPSHGHDQTIVGGISRIGYMSGGRSARWDDETMADVLAGQADKFIERHHAGPFFLYFATHDIHVPRTPHERFQGKTDMGPRGDAIVQLDWCVGEVMKALDRFGLADNTLILFTSDNGPVVDDGYRDEAVKRLGDHQPAGPWRGRKYTAYEGGTRVPWIVRWPARIAGGKESAALVSQVDLPASFAALADAKIPAGAAPDSENVLPALLGEQSNGREELVEHARVLALRMGDWKLIEPAPGKGGKNARPELYNLADDPAEKNNLAAKEPQRAKEMTERLNAIRRN
jgi:arylsulfatase A-like enzyme